MMCNKLTTEKFEFGQVLLIFLKRNIPTYDWLGADGSHITSDFAFLCFCHSNGLLTLDQ